MKTRTCVTCQHLDFSRGSPGYSERTPGTPMHLECSHNLWEYKDAEDADDLRKCFLIAELCPDYKPIPEAVGDGPWAEPVTPA